MDKKVKESISKKTKVFKKRIEAISILKKEIMAEITNMKIEKKSNIYRKKRVVSY